VAKISLASAPGCLRELTGWCQAVSESSRAGVRLSQRAHGLVLGCLREPMGWC